MFRLNKNVSISLKPDNEGDNIKTKLQFTENQIDIHNMDSALIFKPINNIVYLNAKGLNVISNCFLFLHQNEISNLATSKLSSFNTKIAKINFTISLDSLFEKPNPNSVFKLFPSIYPNTVYLCAEAKPYKKINLITGK